MRALSLIALIPALAIAEDAREIVRRAVELDRKDVEISRQYTFLQRQEECDLDGAGRPKNHEIRTFDVTLLEGSPYRRLVARGDQPLSAKDQQAEDEKLRASIEQRRKETPEERSRRVAEWGRKQEKQREPVKELVEAFDFRMAGEEALNGGETWVIDATAKPGYKPKSTATTFFPKVKLRLWIDKREYQWVRMQMDVLDTISFGGFLLRIAKGGHLMVEQTRVNSEVWLPKRATVTASARLLLVKGYHKSFDITFSDYKKFQVESRVVSAEEK